MGHDPFSPICLAQINLLCLPAVKTSKHRYIECVTALKSQRLVSLKDDRSKALDINGGPPVPDSIASSVLFNITEYQDALSVQEPGSFDNNREAQIILGIVPSDDVAYEASKDYISEVRSISDGFRAKAGSYAGSVVHVLMVVGGPTVVGLNGCVWVDLEGEQSTLHDAMCSLADMFRQALPSFLERLRERYSRIIDTSQSAQVGSNVMKANRGTSMTGGHPHEDGIQMNQSSYRHSTLFGLMNLQAGRWSDAVRFLSEAATAAQASGEHAWHAKALEGLLVTMLLNVWAGRDFTLPPIVRPSVDKHAAAVYSSSMSTLLNANRTTSTSIFGNDGESSIQLFSKILPHLVSTIIGHYEKAANTLDSFCYQLMLSEARLRWINLFVLMRHHLDSLQTGVIDDALAVHDDQSRKQKPDLSRPALKLHDSVLASMMADAALEAETRLPGPQAMSILFAIARNMSLLGSERRQAFYLKNALQLFIPTLLDARRKGAAEIGVHPAANLPQLISARTANQLRSTIGVRELLTKITELYGLPAQYIRTDANAEALMEHLTQSLRFWVETNASGDLAVKLEVLSLCIEISDAVPDPESSLYFTSCLLQASKLSITVPPILQCSLQFPTPEDLSRLLQNMRKAIGAAEKFGLPEIRAGYWDDFLVRGIQLLEVPETGALMPHTARDLSIAAVEHGDDKKDPFIFNPFAKSTMLTQQAVVAAGDLVQFTVVLQNPVDCDIEIDDISLLTEGCEFSASHHSIVLGPSCSQAFVLSGKPIVPGLLKVMGCRATICSCYSRAFLILPGEWQSPLAIKQYRRFPARHAAPHITPPEARTLEVRVIEPLPVLSHISTSLAQPSLMLLEGESKVVEVTLRNESTIDVDFVLITFQNNVTKMLEETLGNKALNPADVYEIQKQIASRGPVRWRKKQGPASISSQTSASFSLEIFGDPGLKEISVFIDYAYLNKSRSEIVETFYTRRMVLTLQVTVNGSIDISRCTILPVHHSVKELVLDEVERILEEQLAERDECPSNECLLGLDVRNVWPHPLQIELHTMDPDLRKAANSTEGSLAPGIKKVLQPGETKKIFVKIARLFVAEPHALIPNLDPTRQFVVSVSRVSLEAELIGREAFWFRERLLECLHGTWNEIGGDRCGRLNIRKAVRLSPRMIDALRAENVEVTLMLKPDDPSITSTEGPSIECLGNFHFSLSRNTFARLVTTVHNRSERDLLLMLRLQPAIRNQPHNVALDLARYFTYSGALQRTLHPPLQPGERRAVELGIAILAAGQYEVSATLEEVRGSPVSFDKEAPKFSSDDGRKMWHSTNPCFIDIHDDDSDN